MGEKNLYDSCTEYLSLHLKVFENNWQVLQSAAVKNAHKFCVRFKSQMKKETLPPPLMRALPVNYSENILAKVKCQLLFSSQSCAKTPAENWTFNPSNLRWWLHYQNVFPNKDSIVATASV